jgi:hypothetical protein
VAGDRLAGQGAQEQQAEEDRQRVLAQDRRTAQWRDKPMMVKYTSPSVIPVA